MDSSNVAGSSSILVIFQPTLFASDVVSLRDEWLGEKYLECKLSERLVRDASEVDKTTSLNGRLIQALAGFQHDKCFEELSNRPVRPYLPVEGGRSDGAVDFRGILMGWMGAIQSRGTGEEQDTLARVVLQQHAEFGGPQSTVHPASIVNAEVNPQGPDGEESDLEDSKEAMWQYTSRLQEIFAGRAATPVYTESTIRYDPPRFQVSVTFRQKTAIGEAGNKKLAKHRASKKLCALLDIEVAEKRAVGL